MSSADGADGTGADAAAADLGALLSGAEPSNGSTAKNGGAVGENVKKGFYQKKDWVPAGIFRET